MQDFLRGRINLVRTLIADVPAASYADLVLIICAVLSACSSRRWPGQGIDKRKFIELLVMHSPPDFRTSWVSAPALINKGLIGEDETPYGVPGNTDRIYRDDEIDLSFEDTKKNYPNVPPDKLRKHCYASLIYEWLRCGYSHEYCPHENITHVPAGRHKARISYIGRLTNSKIKRMVSFHLDYLISLAEYHISILPSSYSPRPSFWWIDNG